MVLGQAGQDVVQPRPDPFQLSVKGRQDPHSDQEVPKIIHCHVRCHGLERGMGDLDLALAMDRKMPGPVERLNQYRVVCGRGPAMRVSNTGCS